MAEVAETVGALVDMVLHYADEARRVPAAGNSPGSGDA